MGALLLAFLPVIEGLVAHEAIGAIFAGLTEAQWVTLAADLLNISEPELAAALTTKLKELRPEVASFLADILLHGHEALDSAAASVFIAFEPLRSAPMIPGYAGDGSLIDIPNPEVRR
jgi:hypothetical protein